MKNQFSQIKWVRVLLTALVVYIASFLAILVVVTAYASYLGFLARGAPDQAAIIAFANQYAPWIGPVALFLFAAFGARHVARRVDSAIPLHGVLTGALAGLVNLLLDGFSVNSLVSLILAIGAGWLGARLSGKQ
jgi:hypothetical protein